MSAWEKGEFEPEHANQLKLAETLRFPVDFFFGADVENPSEFSASFRALKSMTASQRHTALGAGAIAFLLNDWIEQRFDLPRTNVPDLSLAGGPEAAAAGLRQLWGIGELPIKNVVHLLEAYGVRVFSLVIDAVTVDAFSMWRGDTPFVFLNTRKSSEHSRFDGAHELGHLLLHRHGAPHGQRAEMDANAFASAFLMPRSGVLANAPRFATVDSLLELKKYWNVSLAALTYRLHKLGVLSDWHYRELFIEISARGYRKQEPRESPREMSQIFAKVFTALRQEGISRDLVAQELKLPVDEISQLVFGLSLTDVPGAGVSTFNSSPPRGNLRVV